MNSSQQPNKSYKDLWRYAGLGAQIFAAIGLAVFAGMKADKWLKFSTPLLVWILPLIVIAGMIYRIIKDTAKRK